MNDSILSITMFGFPYYVIIQQNKPVFVSCTTSMIFNLGLIPDIWKKKYPIGRIIQQEDIDMLESLNDFMNEYLHLDHDIDLMVDKEGYVVQAKKFFGEIFVIKKGRFPMRTNRTARIYKKYEFVKRLCR